MSSEAFPLAPPPTSPALTEAACAAARRNGQNNGGCQRPRKSSQSPSAAGSEGSPSHPRAASEPQGPADPSTFPPTPFHLTREMGFFSKKRYFHPLFFCSKTEHVPL